MNQPAKPIPIIRRIARIGPVKLFAVFECRPELDGGDVLAAIFSTRAGAIEFLSKSSIQSGDALIEEFTLDKPDPSWMDQRPSAASGE